jgi:DNA polymerase Ligase (LigD)
MPRFAILEHDYPILHWDFLLESGDVLLTWRLSAPPESGVIVEALKVFDHRRLYLDYKGPLSGGRGRVTRWDGGTFDWEAREPARMAVRLYGARLRGVFRLELLDSEMWRGEFRADAAGSLFDLL